MEHNILALNIPLHVISDSMDTLIVILEAT
jgi:hypothetical protein